MGFKYNPSEAIACLPEGEYPATIKKAEEAISKASNAMIVLTFEVHDEKRGRREVVDYITEAMAWKLKRIAQAIGAESSFLKGEFFANDYIGRHLLLNLTVEENAKYGEQNKIKSYLRYTGAAPSAPVVHTEENIPF